MSNFEKYLRDALRLYIVWMKTGVLDSDTLDQIFMKLSALFQNEVEKKIKKSIDSVKTEFGKIDLLMFDELQRDVMSHVNQKLRDYKFLFQNSPDDIIGRRGQDLVRELSIESLEQGLLNGSPTAFVKSDIIKKIRKDFILPVQSKEEAMKFILKERQGMLKKIPVFHESGRAKFMLHVRPYNGRYMAFDVDYYAELVGQTTTNEADIRGQISRAKFMGTRLLKYNDTGKSPAQYMREGDERCAKINNTIVTYIKGGITIGKKFYPYYKSLVPGIFDTAHPKCRHFLKPYPEPSA